MRTSIARSPASRVVCVLVLAFALRPTAARAGIPERLQWVRGTVADVASDSVTIALRGDKRLVVPIDWATEVSFTWNPKDSPR